MATNLQILILALIQGACELLPVSSSAHVIVAEKLMGLNPSSPQMTMLLVMMHTGTMFAVIVYFCKDWKYDYFMNTEKLKSFLLQVTIATVATVVVGGGLVVGIEKVVMHGRQKAEIEELFSNLRLIATALAAVGLLIIWAGMRDKRSPRAEEIGPKHSLWIGIVQGLCLPFRGFSRSGATISTGLLFGLPRKKMEEFSFALAVVITPLAIAKEALRLHKAHVAGFYADPFQQWIPGLVGLILSFFSGLVALDVLTRLLEGGRWKYFGYYCLFAACAILFVNSIQH